jgi:hypothetical protein
MTTIKRSVVPGAEGREVGRGRKSTEGFGGKENTVIL